jgi:hypothetical protein
MNAHSFRFSLIALMLLAGLTVQAVPQQVTFTVGGDNEFTISDGTGTYPLTTDTSALGTIEVYIDSIQLYFCNAFNVGNNGDSNISTFSLSDPIGADGRPTGCGAVISLIPGYTSLVDGTYYIGFKTTTSNYGWMQITVDQSGSPDSPADDTITIVQTYIETRVDVPLLAGVTTGFPANIVAVAYTAGGDNEFTVSDGAAQYPLGTDTPALGTIDVFADNDQLYFGNTYNVGNDADSNITTFSAGTVLGLSSAPTGFGAVISNFPGYTSLADGTYYIGFRTTTNHDGWMQIQVDQGGTPDTPPDDTITILATYIESTVGLGIEVASTGGPTGPDIDVKGNGTSIANGDTTPSAADDTDFGSDNVGNTVTKIFTINNAGDSDLTISAAGITISSGSSDFSINTTPALPLSIAAAGSATFSVDFDPSSIATDITATVSIASDDGDENPFTFNVHGDGTAPPTPEINITGNGVSIADGDTTPDLADDTDFGTNGQGNPVANTFTIQNVGGVSLNVTAVTGGGDYAISGIATPIVIGASGNATFDVTWTPSGVGPTTQDIVVTSDDADEGTYNFRVGGTAVSAVPEINVTGNGQNILDGDTTPDAADDTDFGTVTSGTNRTATFTIENNGYDTLNITGVTRSSGSADYTISGISPPVAIPVAGSTTFAVTYSAAVFSATTAEISIANDDSDENPYTFTVGGTGQPAGPLVSVSGNGQTIVDGDATPDVNDHTNFSTVAVGSSFARTFTITNAGDATLTVNGISTGGAGAAEFAATSIPSTIGVGLSATFLVTYSPTGIGTDTASVNIASDDATSPYVFSVSGAGVNDFDADDGAPGSAGDASGDSFSITRVGGNLEIRVNGTLVATVAETEPITINGSADDDTLTLDLAGGAMPDITYNGGGGYDTLVLQNADGTTMTYTPSSTTDGTLDLDGNSLTFTGLAPITQSGTVADVVIDTTAPGAQTIDIDATATDTTVDANGGFELITFSNATNSLIVNAGDGDDTISLNTYAGAAISLTLNGGTGDDTINLPYSVTAAGNTLVVSGSSHTAGDTFNFDPQGNGITVSGPSPGTITGITAGTLSYNTIETINTVGEIDVLGNGNSIADGDLTPAVIDDTDFGNATVGLTSAIRTFTISNTGAASINVNLPVVINGDPEFTVSDQPDALIAPGGSTTFDVTFTPSTSGTFTAQVEITNDDADEGLYNFAIEADGDPPPSTIPTMGEWGMIILCLLMGSFGLAYMRRESFAFASAGEGGRMNAEGGMLPLDGALFKKCILVFAGITIAGCAASIAHMGYVQLSDAVGGPIAAAVAAYFAHLVLIMKREQH